MTDDPQWSWEKIKPYYLRVIFLSSISFGSYYLCDYRHPDCHIHTAASFHLLMEMVLFWSLHLDLILSLIIQLLILRNRSVVVSLFKRTGTRVTLLASVIAPPVQSWYHTSFYAFDQDYIRAPLVMVNAVMPPPRTSHRPSQIDEILTFCSTPVLLG